VAHRRHVVSSELKFIILLCRAYVPGTFVPHMPPSVAEAVAFFSNFPLKQLSHFHNLLVAAFAFSLTLSF